MNDDECIALVDAWKQHCKFHDLSRSSHVVDLERKCRVLMDQIKTLRSQRCPSSYAGMWQSRNGLFYPTGKSRWLIMIARC